jgi:hypothetical protein
VFRCGSSDRFRRIEGVVLVVVVVVVVVVVSSSSSSSSSSSFNRKDAIPIVAIDDDDDNDDDVVEILSLSPPNPISKLSNKVTAGTHRQKARTLGPSVINSGAYLVNDSNPVLIEDDFLICEICKAPVMLVDLDAHMTRHEKAGDDVRHKQDEEYQEALRRDYEKEEVCL